MFVWNAISSIVRMIFAISSLEIFIALIAALIAFMSAAPRSAAAHVSLESWLACSVLSEFRFVIAASCSSDALVSSMAAACSLEPSASPRLDSEICAAADANMVEFSVSDKISSANFVCSVRKLNPITSPATASVSATRPRFSHCCRANAATRTCSSASSSFATVSHSRKLSARAAQPAVSNSAAGIFSPPATRFSSVMNAAFAAAYFATAPGRFFWSVALAP